MAARHAGAGPVRPSTNGGPPSDAQHDDMANTEELRLIATYSLRRHPGANGPARCGNDTPAPPPPPADEAVKKKKKKKKGKSFKSCLGQIFPCVCAPKQDDAAVGEQASFRHGGGGEEDDDAEEKEREAQTNALAATLMELADESFLPPEIEEDSEDDELEKMAGRLLRQCGDSVDEEYNCQLVVAQLVGSYSMFSRFMGIVFRMIGIQTSQPGDQGEKDTKQNIAVTCEVASRLVAMDTQPSRVLDLGARYLRENYPVEAALNEAAEDSDSEDEVD